MVLRTSTMPGPPRCGPSDGVRASRWRAQLACPLPPFVAWCGASIAGLSYTTFSFEWLDDGSEAAVPVASAAREGGVPPFGVKVRLR